MNIDPASEFKVDASRPEGALAILRSTRTIRERAAALLARARRGESAWFTIADDGVLDEAARTVADVTRGRYAAGPIPPHSRWRHFEAGGIDRLAQLDALLGEGASAPVRARAQIDLVVISVLLDAGAGPDWRYVEPASGATFTRSQGLAVASFHAFTAGLFSSNANRPLQADSMGLRGLVTDHLAQALQVSQANAMTGLAGRATLLRRLGEVLGEQPEVFGVDGRPSGLFDLLTNSGGPELSRTLTISANEILLEVLTSLAPIWPAHNSIDSLAADGSDVPGAIDPSRALGDCWRHSAVEGPGLTRGWMPFHKLSQWLTYSLLEPFARAGVRIVGTEHLTPLPEYRNGGLLLDAGVIVPRDAALLEREWKVGDEFIVEWRALTVALLDEMAPRVRHVLGVDAAQLPMASMLEGGTWAAGRALAERLRGGLPPVKIVSDGTVF